MSTVSAPQLIYVVRLWPSGPADPPEQPTWRVSVQDPSSGERHIFADLEAFFTFVEEQTRATLKADQPEPHVSS